MFFRKIETMNMANLQVRKKDES